MEVRLNLMGVMITGGEPRPSYVYKDGVKTEEIDGYMHRVIDLVIGEVFRVKLPKPREFKQGSRVNVVNPVGRFYAFDGNSGLSVTADDMTMVSGK